MEKLELAKRCAKGWIVKGLRRFMGIYFRCDIAHFAMKYRARLQLSGMPQRFCRVGRHRTEWAS
jgi:hypothetical protein